MRVISLAALSLAGMGLLGCASVVRGTTEHIQFMTDPPGAEARTTIGFSCITPCGIPLSRKDEFTVIFTKQGYQPEQVAVRTQVGGGGAAGVAGNILLGGAVGIVADVATGAALDHCPNPVVVFMYPIGKRKPDDVRAPDAHCTKYENAEVIPAGPPG